MKKRVNFNCSESEQLKFYNEFYYKERFVRRIREESLLQSRELNNYGEKENLSLLSRLLTRTDAFNLTLDNSSEIGINNTTIFIGSDNKIRISFDYFDVNGSFDYASKLLFAFANLLRVYIHQPESQRGTLSFQNLLDELKIQTWKLVSDSKLSSASFFHKIEKKEDFERFSDWVCNSFFTLFDFDKIINGILDLNDNSWEKIRKALLSHTSEHLSSFFYVNSPCTNSKQRVSCLECKVCKIDSLFLVSHDEILNTLPVELDEQSELKELIRERTECSFKRWTSDCYRKQNLPFQKPCFHCYSLVEAKRVWKDNDYQSLEEMIQFVIWHSFDDLPTAEFNHDECFFQARKTFILSQPSNFMSLKISDISKGNFHTTLDSLDRLNRNFVNKSKLALDQKHDKVFSSLLKTYFLVFQIFENTVLDCQLNQRDELRRLKYFFSVLSTHHPILSNRNPKQEIQSRSEIQNKFAKGLKKRFLSGWKKKNKGTFVEENFKISLEDGFIISRDNYELKLSSFALSVADALSLDLTLDFDLRDRYPSKSFVFSSTNPSLSNVYDAKHVFFSSIFSVVSKLKSDKSRITFDHFSPDHFSSLLRTPLNVKDSFVSFTFKTIENIVNNNCLFEPQLGREKRSNSLSSLDERGVFQDFFKCVIGFQEEAEEIDYERKSLALEQARSFLREQSSVYRAVIRQVYEILANELIVLTMIDNISNIGKVAEVVKAFSSQENCDFFQQELFSDHSNKISFSYIEEKINHVSWFHQTLKNKKDAVKGIDHIHFWEDLLFSFSSIVNLSQVEDSTDFYNSVFQIATFITDGYLESKRAIDATLRSIINSLKADSRLSNRDHSEALSLLSETEKSNDHYPRISSIFSDKTIFLSFELVSSCLLSHHLFYEKYKQPNERKNFTNYYWNTEMITQ